MPYSNDDTIYRIVKDILEYNIVVVNNNTLNDIVKDLTIKTVDCKQLREGDIIIVCKNSDGNMPIYHLTCTVNITYNTAHSSVIISVYMDDNIVDIFSLFNHKTQILDIYN